MRWLFKDIVVVVGLVIMASIVVVSAIGFGLDIQQIRENIAIWGLTWFEFSFLVLGVAFWVVVIKLIKRLNKFEKNRLDIEVVPCFPSMGRELTLRVHNKSDIRALISATMTCKQYNNDKEEGAFVIESKLVDASICWEATGNYEQNLKADGWCHLKLCKFGEKTKDGVHIKYITFIKMDGGVEKEVEFARHTQNDTPKVVIKIHFDAEPSIKGKREWKFLIEPTPNLLMIRPEAQLIGKPLIRKIFRLNKFKERITE